MRRRAISVIAVTALLGLACPATALASCVLMSLEEQRRRAELIFVGVALEGPTGTGIQRFRVRRYLKGMGSGEVAIATGVTRRPDGSGRTTSVSVKAAAGERWRIYATRRADGGLETNQCAGSSRLASVTVEPPPSEGSKRSTKALILSASLGGVALLGLALGFRRRASRND